MRLAIIVAVAAILAPVASSVHPVAPALAQGVTDLSAAKKTAKPKKPAKKEEYLKAAPSAPPSGGKSTY